MKHKKWWAALLALTLAVALTACGGKGGTEEAQEPTPAPDPAAALVGSWTNKDGVGLKFTSDGTVTLTGFGLTLKTDTFTYEVTGENTLTLTASVAGLVDLDMECPYGIAGDTLFIEIQDYSFELTKK